MHVKTSCNRGLSLANKKSIREKPGVVVRQQAVYILREVIDEYRSLDDVLADHLHNVCDKDQALLQMLCYGVMRWHIQLQAWLEQCANREPGSLEPPVRLLILLGLYQLHYTRIPAHAAIHATVECAKAISLSRATGLINAVLRQYQRLKKDHALVENDAATYSHQPWMLVQLQADWPASWEDIVASNNIQAPMVLRVNTGDITVEEYIDQLAVRNISARPHGTVSSAVVLENALDVDKLPGFSQGLVSVQDAAAQLATFLLEPEASDRVLDACAAPGGKTAHILQYSATKQLTVLDSSQDRMQKVDTLLQRIRLHAETVVGDAADPDTWWDGQPYDRILLDVPCSASGVIRRHPDIKHHRSKKALLKVVKRQQKILDGIWPLLKPGGRLVYATCSVFRDENDRQINRFLERQHNAAALPLRADWGHGTVGRQIFPGEDAMDGFYYAILEKH